MISHTFKVGEELIDAYERQVALVRREPQRLEHRVSLFQMYCVRGEWDRAINQLATLNTLAGSDPELQVFLRTYDSLIRCERYRLSVFAAERQPLVLGEPEPWVAEMLQALLLEQQGHSEEAALLRDLAFANAPTVSFKINDGSHQDWIADADSRFGPMLEAFMDGKYYWIPWASVQEIEIEEPTDLRDLVWLPATVTFPGGGQRVFFLPVRYPGSEASADQSILLARKTEWIPLAGEGFKGVGQHLLCCADGSDIGLLDIRRITRLT